MYYIIGLQSFKRNFFANRIYTLVNKIYFHRSYNYNSLLHCLQNEVPILITDHVQTGNQRLNVQTGNQRLTVHSSDSLCHQIVENNVVCDYFILDYQQKSHNKIKL